MTLSPLSLLPGHRVSDHEPGVHVPATDPARQGETAGQAPPEGGAPATGQGVRGDEVHQSATAGKVSTGRMVKLSLRNT